jgi:hypothetical protein
MLAQVDGKVSQGLRDPSVMRCPSDLLGSAVVLVSSIL